MGCYWWFYVVQTQKNLAAKLNQTKTRNLIKEIFVFCNVTSYILSQLYLTLLLYKWIRLLQPQIESECTPKGSRQWRTVTYWNKHAYMTYLLYCVHPTYWNEHAYMTFLLYCVHPSSRLVKSGFCPFSVKHGECPPCCSSWWHWFHFPRQNEINRCATGHFLQ